MKFREHRGGLAQSLETVIDINSRAELVAHVYKMLEPFYFDKAAVEAGLFVEPYCWGVDKTPFFDRRTGWHTYIVTLKGYGPIGFSDGPLPDEAAAEVFKGEHKAAE